MSTYRKSTQSDSVIVFRTVGHELRNDGDEGLGVRDEISPKRRKTG